MNKISTNILQLLGIYIVIVIISTLVKCTANTKDDVILKQNTTHLYVKQYKTNLKIGKQFIITYDSIYNAYKQNKILYKGKIIYADHDSHMIIIKQNDKFIPITNMFSHSQINDIEENIGKNIIVTKTYYPKDKIYYKFQK